MSFMMSFEVTDEVIADVVDQMYNWYQLKLTPEQVEAILRTDSEVALDITESGMDTLAREKMIDLVGKYIGMPEDLWWPTYGEGKEGWNRFAPVFAEKTAAKNIIWEGIDVRI